MALPYFVRSTVNSALSKVQSYILQVIVCTTWLEHQCFVSAVLPSSKGTGEQCAVQIFFWLWKRCSLEKTEESNVTQNRKL